MGAIVSVKERARKKTMAITAFEGKILRKQDAHDAGVRQERTTVATVAVGVDGKFRTNEFQNKNQIGAVYEGKSASVGYDDRNARRLQDTASRDEKLNVRSYGPAENNTTTLYHAGNHGNQTSVLNNVAPQDVHQIASEKGLKVVKTGERKLKSGDKLEVIPHDRVRPVSDDNNHGGYYLNPCGENYGKIHSSQYSTEAMVNPTTRRMPPAKHSAKILPGPPASPVNFALGSWEGVVGTSDHMLKSRGHVTSRGLDVTVKSSADFYGDFAYVSSYASPIPPSPGGREIEIRDREKPHKTESCNCRICGDARRRERAAVKIQSHLRGYQARKDVMRKTVSVVKIQRIYRKKVATRLSSLKEPLAIPHRNKTSQGSRRGSRRSLSDSSTHTPVIEGEVGQETKESFQLYQEDITELKWQSQQLIEISTMGEDYEPQKVLVISSTVPKSDWLVRVTLQDVHVILYQFKEIKLRDILDNIVLSLNDYRVGSKARRIAFVVQGGPGYMYLCRGKVLTSQKLKKDRELRDFLKELGILISKKDPLDAKVHIIGNNILGNKKGVQLLEDIRDAMKPCRVTVESPFEMSLDGFKMLDEYFDVDLYKVWKRNRYNKINI